VKIVEIGAQQTPGSVTSDASYNPIQHALVVRVTHWVNSFAFLALVLSGVAILLAHPRLYWGETGAFGTPPWIELPLPLNLDQSGWGRSLHFLAAWICVLNGSVYVFSGVGSQHFSKYSRKYSATQRGAYLAVVFVLFPLVIATGLAMSPAIAAVVPGLVALFGGHQSSRTIHFLVTDVLIMFLLGHVAIVYLSGFRTRMRGMILGR
jgi:thiosulfate reductase cytochrome b subunit